MRPSKRKDTELRDILFTRQFTKHAEGSVLVQFGHTKVICTATAIPGVPRFLKEASQGWITAEYGMLPRSTHSRMDREAAKGKQSGRTIEIQRLIGRSLRAAVDLKKLVGTIIVDCDVIEADGGTRAAAISGGYIALCDALSCMQHNKLIGRNPIKNFVAAVSVGIYRGNLVLDLDYPEDSAAEIDMNIVMTGEGEIVEIQGTAERRAVKEGELQELVAMARNGIMQIVQKQKIALGSDL